jgi:hypothetical protein
VEKNGEKNWKVGNNGEVINQTLALGPEHDKIHDGLQISRQRAC